PRFAARFEQIERPDYVGADERARIHDAPIHVALGGEVDHCVGPMSSEDEVDGGAIGDVASLERIARKALDGSQARQVGGVTELVHVDELVLRKLRHEIYEQVRSNETCAARNENLHTAVPRGALTPAPLPEGEGRASPENSKKPAPLLPPGEG